MKRRAFIGDHLKPQYHECRNPSLRNISRCGDDDYQARQETSTEYPVSRSSLTQKSAKIRPEFQSAVLLVLGHYVRADLTLIMMIGEAFYPTLGSPTSDPDA